MSEKPLPDARPRHRAAPTADVRSRATQAASAEAETGSQSPAGPTAATPDYPAYPVSATLHWSETQEDYEDIRSYFFSTMNPTPGVETMLVNSIVDQTREIRELEVAKKALVRLALKDTLVDLMKPTATHGQAMLGWPELNDIARRWAYGTAGSVTEVSARLALIGMSIAGLRGYASAAAISDIDRAASAIERAERRRDRMVKTFEQSRALHSLVGLRKVQMQRASGALVSDADAPAIAGTFRSVD